MDLHTLENHNPPAASKNKFWEIVSILKCNLWGNVKFRYTSILIFSSSHIHNSMTSYDDHQQTAMYNTLHTVFRYIKGITTM